MRVLIALFLSLISFSLCAMNNTSSIGSGIINTFLLSAWFLAAIIILFIFVRKYVAKPLPGYTVAIYSSFASLIVIYYFIFSVFYTIKGSLIFDNEVINDTSKDKATGQFWALVVMGSILLISIGVFIAFHVKSHRKLNANKPT